MTPQPQPHIPRATMRALWAAAELEADDRHQEADRARIDAFRYMKFELQEPADYARYLDADLAEMLMAAWPNEGCFMVREQHAPELRRMGLVEARGRHLTGYGYAVRKALLAGLA